MNAAAIPAVSAALLLATTFTSCETPGRSAMAGAAAGAAIGGLAHGRGRDAVRGAAIGAGAGYLLGKLVEHSRGDRYSEEDRYYDDGRPYYRDRRYSRSYPVAEPTNRRGFVTSPFPPYHLIDVRGIPRGAKVADPSNGRIFINP